jgi:hypothetical protein
MPADERATAISRFRAQHAGRRAGGGDLSLSGATCLPTSGRRRPLAFGRNMQAKRATAISRFRAQHAGRALSLSASDSRSPGSKNRRRAGEAPRENSETVGTPAFRMGGIMSLCLLINVFMMSPLSEVISTACEGIGPGGARREASARRARAPARSARSSCASWTPR